MSEQAKVRLVRCPKCENLLPQLNDYSVYQCGGCGAVLQGNIFLLFLFLFQSFQYASKKTCKRLGIFLLVLVVLYSVFHLNLSFIFLEFLLSGVLSFSIFKIYS